MCLRFIKIFKLNDLGYVSGHNLNSSVERELGFSCLGADFYTYTSFLWVSVNDT